jgi:spermidine synthase
VRRRVERLMQTARLRALHLEDEYAVLGSFIADAASLARFAAGAPLNTDDRPVVAHRAPWLTYASAETPRARLLYVLGAVQVHADAISLDAPLQRARLSAYWNARTHYVQVGARAQPNPDARAMLSQVGAALLSIVEQSPDFRPAYDPLLSMAQAVLPVDSARAIALLTQLSAVQPARPEAAEFLQRIRAALSRQDPPY